MSDQQQQSILHVGSVSAINRPAVSGLDHQLVGAKSTRLGLTRTEYAAAIRYFTERSLNPVEAQARKGPLS